MPADGRFAAVVLFSLGLLSAECMPQYRREFRRFAANRPGSPPGELILVLNDRPIVQNVENLTLTGTANLNGTGNNLNNILTGNSGNNILTGLAGNDSLDGKAGTDTMIGGLGNDTYTVDNTGDIVTENLNEGTDTVQASISYTLSDNVENLTLTGTANLNGTGNNLNNIIFLNNSYKSRSF